MLFALPVLRGSKVKAWWTARLIGLLHRAHHSVRDVLGLAAMPGPLVRAFRERRSA
jgi:hypothetical protein